MEKLDLTSFKKAIDSLEVVLNKYDEDNTDAIIRDSCIQRFEYCYHLSIGLIKRYLKNNSDDPSGIEQMSFYDKIREAYKQNIIKNSLEDWERYRDYRNDTSHGYNEDNAIKIVTGLWDFYNEIDYLYRELDRRNETKI